MSKGKNIGPGLVLAGVATVGIALVVSQYAGTGEKIKQLRPFVDSVNYVKQSGFLQNLLTTKFVINLKVENPNKKPVTINECELVLLYAGKRLTGVRFTKPLTVNAEKITNIKGVQVSVSNFSAFNVLMDVIRKSEESKMTVEGFIKADGFLYPIKETVNLKELKIS